MFRYDSKLMRALGDAVDYLIVNILYVIFCIPIITIGAASTARYYVAMKAARGLDVYVWKDFTGAFFSNFKMATKAWLIILGVYVVLILDWALIFSYKEAGFSQIHITLIIFLTLAIILFRQMVFPFIARFDNTLFNTLKLSMGLTFLNLFKLIAVIALEILPFLTSYRYIQWAYLIIPVGSAAALYINSHLIANSFRKIEGEIKNGGSDTSFKPDPVYDDEEAGKEEKKAVFDRSILESKCLEESSKEEDVDVEDVDAEDVDTVDVDTVDTDKQTLEKEDVDEAEEKSGEVD